MATSARLSIKGMHCTACVMNIDGELEDTQGVKEAKTNYAKEETTVVFDPTQVTTSELIVIIQKLGYDAAVRNESN